jgi:hypothetical protein
MKFILSAIVLTFGLNSFADSSFSDDPSYRKCIRFNHMLNGNDNPLGDLACDINASKKNRKANEAAEAEKESLLPHACISGCANQAGKVIDLNNLVLGAGNNLNEAKDDANYKATTQFNCQYVAKATRCEVMKSKVSNNYAEVACIDQRGKYVPTSVVSGKGRNKLEAEMIAKAGLKKKFKCNFGDVVIKAM